MVDIYLRDIQPVRYPEVDEAFAMRVADAYEETVHSPDDRDGGRSDELQHAYKYPVDEIYVVCGSLRRCTYESRIEAAEVNRVQHGAPMLYAEQVEVEQLVDRPAV